METNYQKSSELKSKLNDLEGHLNDAYNVSGLSSQESKIHFAQFILGDLQNLGQLIEQNKQMNPVMEIAYKNILEYKPGQSLDLDAANKVYSTYLLFNKILKK